MCTDGILRGKPYKDSQFIPTRTPQQRLDYPYPSDKTPSRAACLRRGKAGLLKLGVRHHLLTGRQAIKLGP